MIETSGNDLLPSSTTFSTCPRSRPASWNCGRSRWKSPRWRRSRDGAQLRPQQAETRASPCGRRSRRRVAGAGKRSAAAGTGAEELPVQRRSGSPAGRGGAGRRTQADGRLVFAVSDSGIGIAEEQQDAIFEAFRQATANRPALWRHRTRPVDLARVTKLLGGEIQLESGSAKQHLQPHRADALQRRGVDSAGAAAAQPLRAPPPQPGTRARSPQPPSRPTRPARPAPAGIDDDTRSRSRARG